MKNLGVYFYFLSLFACFYLLINLSSAPPALKRLATPTPASPLPVITQSPNPPTPAVAPAGYSPSPFPATPDSRFPDSQSTRLYALVAPFPTIADGVRFADVERAWAGKTPIVFAGKPLLMSAETYGALKTLFNGEAASGAVRIVSAEALTEALWQERPQWGVVPFEALNPKLKVLAIDGQSPIRKDFDLAAYPLQVAGIANYDPSKLTTLIMTGVTALVRATAYEMEKHGTLFPGEYIRGALREADIAHISNEISFAQGCPAPDWNSKRLIFCSDPKYIALLDDVGADVVELTGNHMEDWGKHAMYATLQTYQEHGMVTFGGGADLAAAQRAATIERNGVKFAFVGCNPVGPDFDWADVGWPGAAPCGDYQWMVAEIKRMKSQGYIVVATFQYYEYYSPEARPGQRDVFRMMAEAGADVVSGSQAHSAQAMEFDHGAFIHYGLGNLFFDQMNVTDYSRYEFLDCYVFYNGRLVSIDLLTAMLEDYARPGPMGAAERADFLSYIFQASGWLPKSLNDKPRPTPTLAGLP